MSNKLSGVPMRVALSLALAVLTSVSGGWSECDNTSVGFVPINDLGAGHHLGLFVGGLYPDSTNTAPTAHVAGGLVRAASVRRRDPLGLPTPTGRYVLLSVGFSNTKWIFCAPTGHGECSEFSFMGRAAYNLEVDHEGLVIVNGARGGQPASTGDSPADENYDYVRDEVLAPNGLTETQVQAVWVHLANSYPQSSLPASDADAYLLVGQLGDVVRALGVRYPHLQVAFFSTRIYGGFATNDLTPEPYAYETGFAMKWLIGAQINQMDGGGIHPLAGDLDYQTGVVPWIGWGPYLWTMGDRPRQDGFFWTTEDFVDCIHLSDSGETKAGGLLLDFRKSSAYSAPWFLDG